MPLLDLSSTVKSKKFLTFNLEKISQNYLAIIKNLKKLNFIIDELYSMKYLRNQKNDQVECLASLLMNMIVCRI